VALWRLLSVRRDVQREWGGVIAGERVRDIKARGHMTDRVGDLLDIHKRWPGINGKGRF
jgi:hypothetical protein